MEIAPRIEDDDITKLIDTIKNRGLDMNQPLPEEYNLPPALCCIDAVLASNRRYKRIVVPRRKRFRSNNPDICSLPSLLKLLDSMPPEEFGRDILNYRSVGRVKLLRKLVTRLIDAVGEFDTIEDEKRSLKEWATSEGVNGYVKLGIKGIGLATYQYLRMLFGVSTIKPDRHIIRFINDALGKEIDANYAIILMEEAAQRMNWEARALDSAIWKKQSEC